MHCFLAQLLADEEELGLGTCGRAQGLQGFGEVFGWDWVVLVGLHVPFFEDVSEADVVVGGAGAPVDVHIAGPDQVVKDFELELGGQCHQCGGLGWSIELSQGVISTRGIELRQGVISTKGVERQCTHSQAGCVHSSVEIL